MRTAFEGGLGRRVRGILAEKRAAEAKRMAGSLAMGAERARGAVKASPPCRD